MQVRPGTPPRPKDTEAPEEQEPLDTVKGLDAGDVWTTGDSPREAASNANANGNGASERVRLVPLE